MLFEQLDLIVPHGYWLSFSQEKPLGTLSQAQVEATAHAIKNDRVDEAVFTTGRVHLLKPDLVGKVMRDQLYIQNLDISGPQLVDITDPAINNTYKEFLRVFEYAGYHGEYRSVTHVVNPSHLERAKILFDMMDEQRRGLMNGRLINFEVVSAAEFLSKKQIDSLRDSPEQAKFDQREQTAMKLLRNPKLQTVVEHLPGVVKQAMEDLTVWNLRQSS